MIPGYPCIREPWWKRWRRKLRRLFEKKVEVPPITKFTFPVVKNPFPEILTDLSVQPMTSEIEGFKFKFEYKKTTWWDRLWRKIKYRKERWIDGCF